VLDQEPVVPLPGISVFLQAHEHPFAPQASARHDELEVAGAQAGLRRLPGQRRPEAPVPELDRAAAIFAAGYGSFEIPVVERMVLDLDRKALHARIQGRALGHRPGPEYAV
jgi:hypothetical protein